MDIRGVKLNKKLTVTGKSLYSLSYVFGAFHKNANLKQALLEDRYKKMCNFQENRDNVFTILSHAFISFVL